MSSMVLEIICLFVLWKFKVPTTAKVIWGQGHSIGLIQQNGEAGDQTHNPWFTCKASGALEISRAGYHTLPYLIL